MRNIILFIISFFIISFFLVLSVTSCKSNKEKVSIIEDENLELQMIDAYKDAYNELEMGDVIYGGKYASI